MGVKKNDVQLRHTKESDAETIKNMVQEQWVKTRPEVLRKQAIEMLELAKNQEAEKLASGKYKFIDTFKGRKLVLKESK